MHDVKPPARIGRPPLFEDADATLISCRLHPRTHDALCQIAQQQNVSLSDTVRRACVTFTMLSGFLAWRRDVDG